MKTMFAVLAALVVSSAAFAQAQIELPELRVGDVWEFQRTDLSSGQVSGRYAIQITGRAGDEYTVTTAREGQTGVLPVALTAQLGRVTSFEGQRSDNGWLSFPLSPGKTWKASDNWKNKNGNFGIDRITYKVVGTEKTTVAAGSFDTVKVVGEGWWNNNGSNNSGQIEIVFWYSPDVKAIVRYERKDYLKNQVDMSSVTELTAASIGREGTRVAYGKDIFPGAATALGKAIEGVTKDGGVPK